MPTPQEQAQINKLIREGIELAKKLGDAATEASLKNFNGDLTAAKRLVQSLRDDWADYINDIAGAREGFARIVDEIKNMNSGVGKAKAAFSNLASIAAKLQSHQSGTSKLTSKELEDLKKQVQQRRDDLLLAGKLAKERVKELERKATLTKKEQKELNEARATHANITQEITKNIGHMRRLNAQFDEQLRRTKNIEKSLGLSGSLINGLSKSLKGAGFGSLADKLGLDEANKKMDELTARLTDNGDKALGFTGKIRVMGAGMASMGKSLFDNLTSIESVTGLIVAGFKLFLEAGFRADKQVVSIQKSMASTRMEAEMVREEYRKQAGEFSQFGKTIESQVAAQLELADAFGATRGITQQQIDDQIKLTKQIGLTAEEAAGLQQLAMANGKTADEVNASIVKQTASLAKQTGIQLDNKKILSEVAKVGGALRIQYKNNPELIAKAVVETKKLGINLEQAKKMADGLLNFEQSIQSELEAELLTGKDINLENARMLAFQGKSAEAAREMLKQVGSSAEFSNMNVLAQESLAQAMGMTVSEMADSLIQQENLAKLGAETKSQVEERVEQLKNEGKIEEANQLMRSIGNDTQAQAALEEIDAQMRFNDAVDRLKQQLLSILEGPAMDFVNWLAKMTSDTDNLKTAFDGVKKVVAAIAGLIVGRIIWGMGMSVASLVQQNTLLATQRGIQASLAAIAGGKAVAETTAATAISFGAIIPIILGGVAAVAAAMATYSAVEDAVIDPKEGPVVSAYKEGQLHVAQGIKGDKVVMGTDLAGGGVQPVSVSSGMSPEIIRLFEEMNSKLETIANKDTKLVVGIDEWNTSQTKGSVRVQ